MAKTQGADTTAKKVPGRPFKSGAEWNGNAAGRPKSSRNKLQEDFLKAMADDFEKHGKAAIVKVREEDAGKYLTIVAQLVPKESELTVKADDAFVEVWRAVASGTLAAMVEQYEEQEGAKH